MGTRPFRGAPGQPARALRAQILGRCLLGAPGDLLWRAESGTLLDSGKTATLAERVSRSWWIPAPIALEGWMLGLAFANAIGGEADSVWRRLREAGIPALGRPSAVVVFMAIAAACAIAVAVRERRPGLTVALLVPAELLTLTRVRGAIDLWHFLPVLSTVALAGGLYNVARVVDARGEARPERDGTEMKRMRRTARPARELAPGTSLSGRRVATALVVLVSALAIYPVAAGAERLVRGVIGGRPAAGDVAAAGRTASQGFVVTAGLPAVGAEPATDLGSDPLGTAAPPTGGASSGAGGAQCAGTDVSSTAPSTTGGALPEISLALQSWLKHYGASHPGSLSEQVWMNSGGAFGGGMARGGVLRFMREGSAAGLSDRDLMDIVTNQSFMHAANDPEGGSQLLAYIGDNPRLFPQVAQFAETAPSAAGWGADSGQDLLFQAIPELGAVYTAMAGPLHTSGQDCDTVNQLMVVAQQSGTWGDLARRRLDEVLTYGPRATIADRGMAEDLASSGYVPTSPQARAGQQYWSAYAERVGQVQSGVRLMQWNTLPVPPTGAQSPMDVTQTGAGGRC